MKKRQTASRQSAVLRSGKDFPFFLKRFRFFSFGRERTHKRLHEKTAEQLYTRFDTSDRPDLRSCLNLGSVDDAGGNGTDSNKNRFASGPRFRASIQSGTSGFRRGERIERVGCTEIDKSRVCAEPSTRRRT